MADGGIFLPNSPQERQLIRREMPRRERSDAAWPWHTVTCATARSVSGRDGLRYSRGTSRVTLNLLPG